MNSQVFVIVFWFLVEDFKLSARTKDARDTRDVFLESLYRVFLRVPIFETKDLIHSCSRMCLFIFNCTSASLKENN